MTKGLKLLGHIFDFATLPVELSRTFYWGKPTVRHSREDDGNVAIIRGPDPRHPTRPVGPKGLRRNYAETTIRQYIRTVEDFSKRFKRSPDCLGPEHIREYQAELFKKRRLSPGTVTQRLAALRLFCIKTLKKTWSIAEMPYPKKAFQLPSILSREEVARLTKR